MKSLQELSLKKAELKASMKDNTPKNPFSNITDIVQDFMKGKSHPVESNTNTQHERNKLMDEGVKAVLTIVASAAVSRFKLGALNKMILTTGVAMATPYIVDRIQEFIAENRNDQKLLD